MVNSNFLDAIVANTEIFSRQPETEHRGEDWPWILSFGWVVTPSFAENGAESSQAHLNSHEHDGDFLSRSHSHDHAGRHTHSHDSSNHGINEGDMDKLRSTLKQVVRDWSEEVGNATLLKKKKPNQNPLQGKGERETCYTPMVDALINHFQNVPPDERFVPSRDLFSTLDSPTRVVVISASWFPGRVSDA